jgi:hypothetical protein
VHHLGWASLNPSETPTLLVALFLAYLYGYLKLPDTIPISGSTNPSASTQPSASLVIFGLIAYQFLGFRIDSTTNLNPYQNPTLVVALIIAYAYGYLKLPDLGLTGDDPELSTFRRALPAIKAEAKQAEPYFKRKSTTLSAHLRSLVDILPSQLACW